CWVPGPRHRRAVYAPALVAWSDGRFVQAPSRERIPHYWIPLAPREVYVPAHQASPRYLRDVNVSNTLIVNNTQITNISRNRVGDIAYLNRPIAGVVTSAPPRTFVPPRTFESKPSESNPSLPTVDRPWPPRSETVTQQRDPRAWKGLPGPDTTS